MGYCRPTLFLVSQWYKGHSAGGQEDRQDVHGVILAMDEGQAKGVFPWHLASRQGEGCGTFGEVQFDVLGHVDVDVTQRIPVFMFDENRYGGAPPA